MGSFANGTEMMCFYEMNCGCCYHDRDESCPVLLAHFIYDGQDEKVQEYLDLFITTKLVPVTGGGAYNHHECKLFAEEVKMVHPDQMTLED